MIEKVEPTLADKIRRLKHGFGSIFPVPKGEEHSYFTVETCLELVESHEAAQEARQKEWVMRLGDALLLDDMEDAWKIIAEMKAELHESGDKK